MLPVNCNECDLFIKEKPSCIHAHANGVDLSNPTVLPDECPLKEDELDAIRHRVSYRGENFYLVVSTLEGKPREVFAEHATNSNPDLVYMLSGIDTITRLITMALKKYPLEKVIRQLNKSSRQPSDIAGIIADKLEQYK